MDERKKYQVRLGSVLDCQMDGFDHTVVFDEFTQAKDFALDAFQGVSTDSLPCANRSEKRNLMRILTSAGGSHFSRRSRVTTNRPSRWGRTLLPCQKSRSRRLLNWTACSGHMWMHSKSVLSTRSCPRLFKGGQSRLRS